jgi:hypothetical protein
MENNSYITCKNIIKIEHNKLRSQLKSALCWVKNYISILMLSLVNKKIKICVNIPDFICALAINLLSKKMNECLAASFLYIDIKKNCCKIKRKTFKKIAYYCYNGKKYCLHAFDILPLHFHHDCDCECDENIKVKIAQMEGFCKFFSEIISMSEAYTGSFN